MLPYDASYLGKEYWENGRSITSIAKEWGVEPGSIYYFFKKEKIDLRSRGEATANAYRNGIRTNKEHDLETKKTISNSMIEFHDNMTPEEKKKASDLKRMNLQVKGRTWLRSWKGKGARDCNFSRRRATKIVAHIYRHFDENGLSPVLDKRPADIVLSDNTAIVIDGYYRIKNYDKEGWVENRKNKLAEYGFKKIIFCQFNSTYSKGRAKELLNKILEVGIISTDKEVTI